jgi:DNA-binding LacI/PurR family transcriptional regulator
MIAQPVRIPARRGSQTPPRHTGRSGSLNIGLAGLRSEERGSFDFFHEPLYEAVSESIAEAGGRLYVMENGRDLLDFATDTGVDGILTMAVGRQQRCVLERLREAEFPFVVMGAAYDDPGMPCVVVDNAGGIAGAVDHLVGLGHAQIAFIGLNLGNPDHDERWNAFQCAIARTGIYVDPRLFLIGSLPSDGEDVQREIGRWLDRGAPPFTAVIAASHVEGIAALRVLRGHGLHIPNDVSLVTFDDPPSAAREHPALTAVRQPVAEIGRRAVEKLVAAIRSGQMPRGTDILPTRLIVRDSTAPISVAGAWREDDRSRGRFDMPRWIGPCCEAA